MPTFHMTTLDKCCDWQRGMDILHDSYQYGASPLTPDSLQQPLQISLFGKPISKSLSPLLQSILFNFISARWQFSLTETTNLFDLGQECEEKNFTGASITMPNKVTFKAIMDDLTPEALAIGAINTSFVRIDRHDGRRRSIGAKYRLHRYPRYISPNGPWHLGECGAVTP